MPFPDSPQPITTVPGERLWTADDLASHIGCSVREIRNLHYAGLPTIKFRHLICFEPEAAKVWLRKQQQLHYREFRIRLAAR